MKEKISLNFFEIFLKISLLYLFKHFGLNIEDINRRIYHYIKFFYKNCLLSLIANDYKNCI
jgi:hypothetical protein